MRNISLVLICTGAFLGAGFAPHGQAQTADVEGNWMVRVRALHLSSENGNSPAVTGAQVSINDKVFPEIDFAYNFTRNWSSELVLTYPQRHDVRLNGIAIGSVKHLPPTLLLQYQFAPGAGVNPYLGAGLNYTRFMSAQLPPGISVEQDSVGGALQAGADFEIVKNVYLNIDYKYLRMSTDVRASGAELTKLVLNPRLISLGIGWRF